MTQQVNDQRTWLITVSLVIIALVAIAFTLHYTRTILMPFVVAIFIGSIVSPVMDILELRWKISHSASIVIALLVVLLAVTIFTLTLMRSVETIAANSNRYAATFEDMANWGVEFVDTLLPSEDSERGQGDKEDDEALPTDIQTGSTPAANDAKAEPSDAANTDQEFVNEAVPDNTEDSIAAPEATDVEEEVALAAPGIVRAPKALDHPADAQESNWSIRDFLRSLAPRFAASAAGSMLNMLSAGTLTLIFVMFVLAGRDPHVVRTGVYAEIDTQIRSYIATKVALSVGTGLLVWIVLRALHMPMAGVFGLLALLLNFIPSVGSIIATILPIPFALANVYAQFKQPGVAFSMEAIEAWAYWWLLGVILLPGAVQMLIGNVLEPKLMGEGLSLHPITILLALAFWGLLWGPVGMLLATPMMAIIRIVLMRFEITQPTGELLAGKLPELGAKPASDATVSA